ncbi:MAG: hypothetical protein UIK35_06865 [Coprococcus catus]|nr:hypothetical protein [Coprococcus catus]
MNVLLLAAETLTETDMETVLETMAQIARPQAFALKDMISIVLSFIPGGFLLGMIIVIVGLGITGVIKIFNQA